MAYTVQSIAGVGRYTGDTIEFLILKTIRGIYYPAYISYFDFVELSEDLIRAIGNKYKLVPLSL